MEALGTVLHPDSKASIVDGGHVRDVEVDPSGDVRFSFFLGPKDPGTLVREARAAVEGVEGVTNVKVNVQLP